MKTEKKTVLMKQYERILKIHKKIRNNDYPNCASLAKELGVSEMTIRRDMKTLTADKDKGGFGAVLEFDTLNNGFRYVDENFELSLQKNLKTSEVQLLTEAKVFLSHFKNTPVYKEMEEVLDSFCASGKRNDNEDLLLRRIAIAPNPYPAMQINSEVWETLTDALKKNRIVRFRYQAPSSDITEPDLPKKKSESVLCTVHPYQILMDKGSAFLFGFVEEKKDERLFELNKIYPETLVEMAKKFILPEKFEIEHFTGGSNLGAFKRFKPKQYKIAFYEAARPMVRNCNLAKDQLIEEDDANCRTIITFKSAQDMRVLDWVFENKAYALPLEPPEFVARWKYNVSEMARMAGYDVPCDVDIEEVNRLDRE